MTTIDLVLLATEAHEEQGEFTDINFATALWVWIAFIATVLILRKVAWPIFQRKMEERENTIAEGLRMAEEAEERARNLMEQQERILEETRQEAQKVLAESRAQAENVKADLLASAQTEIAAERDRAKKEIGLERTKAVDELQRAAIELTLEASARLLKREMQDEDHRRLAREVVDEVRSGRWGAN
jgi:F-type H+-transporting ATPase subunit b